GLSPATALETVQALYRKFPAYVSQGSRIRINLAGVGGFGADATDPLVYEVETLLLGGGGLALGNDYQYLGAEMVPITPASGPATAALDTPPAVAIAGGSAKAGGTLSVRFDFTVAAPAWTVNDFQGKFLRITRGGVKVVYEMPIARNAADTITCRIPGVAPLILDSDTAEIVEPAIQFINPTIANSGPVIVGRTGDVDINTPDSQLGSAFVRCCFPTGCKIRNALFATFDRCNLDDGGWGAYIDTSNLDFINCTCQYFYLAGGTV
ncbi:unnamed protein product, partial [marine sediment metagenome]